MVAGTRITDVDLIYFQELSQLRYLNLRDAKITNAGLSFLQELYELRFLYLDRTQVTDAGHFRKRKSKYEQAGARIIRRANIETRRVADLH